MFRAFPRSIAWIIVGVVLVGVGLAGCGPWSFPAGYGRSYTIEPKKIGTGQPAITPTNDPWHQNGESMDLRKRGSFSN